MWMRRAVRGFDYTQRHEGCTEIIFGSDIELPIFKKLATLF
jgi:hypothetical protein